MKHLIHRVTSFDFVGPYTLRIGFDDLTQQVIDFEDVLEGELYGPLRNEELFRCVSIDREVQTLVWPNGADFDPAILHNWPEHAEAMKDLARSWSLATR